MPKLATTLTLALTTTPAFAQTATAPEFLHNSAPTAPFARIVQVGDTLYLAGKLGIARPSGTDQTNGCRRR